MSSQINYKVFILAGGRGTRLWPMSTSEFPKQFLKLYSEKSLLQETYDRALKITDESNIYFITTDDLGDLVKQQIPKANLILEPGPKNTAPCIFLALKKIEKSTSPDDVICSLHADHYINNADTFAKDIKTCAQKLIGNNAIGLIGITPTSPHTGYGYINFSGEDVKAFKEKPKFELAKKYLESGDYLWNSGIFLGQFSTFMESFKENCPRFFEKNILDDIESWYSQVEALSFDQGILEKHKPIKVISNNFSWNDLGSWGSFDEIAENVDGNQVLKSDGGQFIESSSNVICTNSLNVNLLGVKDLVIVEQDGTLLVAHKSKIQDIKKLQNP